MKFFDVLCWILLIIGGLNWGLVGIANFDLIATLSGTGSLIAHLIYTLVGLSAIYTLYRWIGNCPGCNKM